jgi:dTMP kinase
LRHEFIHIVAGAAKMAFVFVTFEGPEGAGKSTAIATIAEKLREMGKTVLTTREPGSGPVGTRIRQILLDPTETPIHPRCELFLFLADRAQHVAMIIEPALARGEVVLCDRFADSTVVYQGHARGLDVNMLRSLNEAATGGRTPDLTLLLDVPAEIGLDRVTDKDRLDAEPLEFHERVRQGFLTEAARDPLRWWILDASESPDGVAEQALNAILTL